MTMPKITFVGAGSTVFAKNILGDAMSLESLCHADIALYDIDAQRLDDSRLLIEGVTTNLPRKACVEVPCLVDRNGVRPTVVGDLPEPCAALNRTNINPQILTVEAVLTGKKDHVYQAALLDSHTSAQLSIDETISLCDDMIEAHGDWLPRLV